MPVAAGEMGAKKNMERWYLVGGAGYSESAHINIFANPDVWDNADQGYSNNMGSSASLFFGVGRYLTDYLRLDVRGEHRGTYTFSKFQTGSDTGTPNFTANARIREFDLSSNTVMASAWLNFGSLSPNLIWKIRALDIEPFFGAGAGVDYINVKDFKTRINPFNPRPYEYASVNQMSTGSSFAWHISAGLQTHLTERTHLAIGYNYFDGGDIPFPTYLLASSTTNSRSTLPWSGTFKANEAYAELRVVI